MSLSPDETEELHTVEGAVVGTGGGLCRGAGFLELELRLTLIFSVIILNE